MKLSDLPSGYQKVIQILLENPDGLEARDIADKFDNYNAGLSCVQQVGWLGVLEKEQVIGIWHVGEKLVLKPDYLEIIEKLEHI